AAAGHLTGARGMAERASDDGSADAVGRCARADAAGEAVAGISTAADAVAADAVDTEARLAFLGRRTGWCGRRRGDGADPDAVHRTRRRAPRRCPRCSLAGR